MYVLHCYIATLPLAKYLVTEVTTQATSMTKSFAIVAITLSHFPVQSGWLNLICVFDIVKDTWEVRGVKENESEEAVLHNDICEHAKDLCLQIMLNEKAIDKEGQR